jgi:hypothetical protein
VGQFHLHPNVIRTITKNPNGASVDPRNGRSPQTGYMVSRPGSSMIVNASDLSGPRGGQLLNQFAAQNASALREPGTHVGSWTDPATGKTHLDVSDNIKAKGTAVAAGRKQNQISIYDIKGGRTIDTGGTGG